VVLRYPIAADHLRELRSLLGLQALVFGVDARALTPALFGFQRRFDQVSPLPHAQVTVVLSTSDVYKDWRIESLADGSPLCFVSSRPFNSELYQGYVHRLTKGMAGELKKVVDKKQASVLLSEDIIVGALLASHFRSSFPASL
jgi:hypothetical protein